MMKDEAITRIMQLTEDRDDWSVLPIDDPMTAEEGVVLFHDDYEDGEEGITVKWPIFDAPLEPLVNVVPSAKELLEFGQQHPDAVECSDPKRLLLGLAHYDPDKGKALIVQCRLTGVKQTDDQWKGDFLAMREQKMAEAESRRKAREEEATALAATIQSRAS